MSCEKEGREKKRGTNDEGERRIKENRREEVTTDSCLRRDMFMRIAQIKKTATRLIPSPDDVHQTLPPVGQL
ncbi:MAG: hypothetical protein KAT56_02580 [Sedimentisphaerales bacterium]|nr:hypothetical protein [Sedimentisphaerales bacterium]